MDIGIGLPNSLPGTTGPQLLDWARRAEAAGFSSLATIGAVEYPTYEELTALAAAGSVTERIRLLTDVLIAPARSAVELAKQAASVDQLSGGRLTLGLGVGWRASDYELTGRSFADRGERFDQQLDELHTAWAGQPLRQGQRPVTPAPAQPGGVPLLIGGMTDAAAHRVARHGIGWTAGGTPPEAARDMIERVRAAWRDAGRQGEPRFVVLTYFSLGDTEQQSRANLRDYYSPMGEEGAEMVANSALRSPEAINEAIKAYRDVGFDELILDPTVPDVGQVELLADAIA